MQPCVCQGERIPVLTKELSVTCFLYLYLNMYLNMYLKAASTQRDHLFLVF